MLFADGFAEDTTPQGGVSTLVEPCVSAKDSTNNSSLTILFSSTSWDTYKYLTTRVAFHPRFSHVACPSCENLRYFI
jgi:hypothetical protein